MSRDRRRWLKLWHRKPEETQIGKRPRRASIVSCRNAERNLTPGPMGGQFSRLRPRLLARGEAWHSSVTSCRQRCQRIGTFLLVLQTCEARISALFLALPCGSSHLFFGHPRACFRSFHGTTAQAEHLSRSTSAPQMCKPGLPESISSPELGEALPARDPAFPDFGVTILDKKAANQVSTTDRVLLALRSMLVVTHPDV